VFPLTTAVTKPETVFTSQTQLTHFKTENKNKKSKIHSSNPKLLSDFPQSLLQADGRLADKH
jgi:hypothetical protein